MSVIQLPRARHDRTTAHADPTPIVDLQQRARNSDPDERDREREAEQAWNAVLTADSLLVGSFSSTLDPVVPRTEWNGYPPVTVDLSPATQRKIHAVAVAFLGNAADDTRGWWLHYTSRENSDCEGDLRHVLTLIAPCACGAYAETELADEDMLIALLNELDSEPGAPVPCDYLLRIRGGYTDTRHTSIAPPF